MRLKPTPWLTPIGSSVSNDTEPAKSLPPVRVTIETIPPVALPNSAELDPVVTDASSKALMPIEIWVPADPTKLSPR